MRRLGLYIVIFVLLLMVASYILISLNKDKIEITSPSDPVSIDSLRFCGLAAMAKNQEKVSICGSIIADKQSIPIRMYLYRMPSKILVAENQANDRFVPGEFVREFDISDNNSGTYKIVAYFYKNIVGELEFEIHSP